jgi:hypothetical protein
MTEKDLAEELERLKAENKKLKKKLKPEKSYVLENYELFDSIYQTLQQFPANDGKGMKYFFVRKARKTGEQDELVFKLNLFVKHLLEYKVRINDKIPAQKLTARISMDVGSLISSLQENRTKRPRGGDGISKKTEFKSMEERKQALAELNEWYAKEQERIIPPAAQMPKAKTKKVMDTAVEQLSDLKKKIDEQIEEKRAAEPPPAVLPSVETAPRMEDLGKL